jgi:hypothetical protein
LPGVVSNPFFVWAITLSSETVVGGTPDDVADLFQVVINVSIEVDIWKFMPKALLGHFDTR